MNAMPLPIHALARVRRWQRGGTVTGVIIGLIVGLTVAVWVAMTILKTPLPFVDKISKQTQPAGELGDPNKTMPGGARERRERINDEEPAEPEKTTIVEPVAPPPSAKTAKAVKASKKPSVAKSTKPKTVKVKHPDFTIVARPDRGGFEGWYGGKAEAFRDTVEKVHTFFQKKYQKPGKLVK